MWHKLREAKPAATEGLQLSDVLQGLQPSRKPVPGRISLLKSIKRGESKTDSSQPAKPSVAPEASGNVQDLVNLTSKTEPRGEDPCC